MKIIWRVLDILVTSPFVLVGFLWVQIRCAFWLGQKAGTKYGIWLNTFKKEQVK